MTTSLALAKDEAVRFGVESIGPDEAQKLLATNNHNRHVRPTRVARYARDMVNGEWVLNGETIKVSETGRLIDGQHRLMAVAASGETVDMLVVRGLPDDAQETVDVGDKRSMGDILMLRGERNWNNLAAALMTAYRISHGTMTQTAGWPTNQELLDFLEANPAIRESGSISGAAQKSPIKYPPSQAMALHFLMSQAAGRDAADRFWESLLDGSGLTDDSPILPVRNFLIRELSERRRSTVTYRIAVTIKAWNAVRAGKALASIRWTPSTEPFPAVR